MLAAMAGVGIVVSVAVFIIAAVVSIFTIIVTIAITTIAIATVIAAVALGLKLQSIICLLPRGERNECGDVVVFATSHQDKNGQQQIQKPFEEQS